MRPNIPLLALVTAAALAGCAAESRDVIDEFGKQADDKADSSIDSFVYLGTAPLPRAPVEQSYLLPGARSGVLYVIDVVNQAELAPEETYEVGLSFDQLPALPDPGDVDLDSPPAPPSSAPPRILVFNSTDNAPLAQIRSSCARQPCTLEELDAPDAAFIGEGTEGEVWLTDIRAQDELARLVFAYPDPIAPESASLTTWCVEGCATE